MQTSVRTIALTAVLAGASAVCVAAAQPHAEVDARISIAHCLDTIAHGSARDDARCPVFLIDALKQADQTCTEAGGQLEALATPEVWTVDVNGDGVAEYAFEYEGIVSCKDAWSVFSCGSLGCAKALYQKHAGAWQAVAEIWADAAQSLEVLETPPGPGNRDLRVGCAGQNPCDEYWYLQWDGRQYARGYLEARGHRVDFVDSIHGLYGLVRETDVLATPTADGAVVGHYGSDTEVAIVGTASGADYYYVSPCNACASGFVRKAAVRPPQQ